MPPHPQTDRLAIRQPIPLPGETREQYHELHQTYGLVSDGRCYVCFAPTTEDLFVGQDAIDELNELKADG